MLQREYDKMHDLEANRDSVNFLIKKLCLSVLQEYPLTTDEIVVALPKLKALAYEILLKKTARSYVEENENFEPQRALDIQIFAAKLYGRGRPGTCSKFKDFQEYVKIVENEKYFQEDSGKGILQFLLALQGHIVEESKRLNMDCSKLLIPGPFTLHANYQQNSYYPLFDVCNIMEPTPKYFQSLSDLKSKTNPYLPKFLFAGEKNQLENLFKKFDEGNYAQYKKADCTFTGLTRRLLGTCLGVNLKAFPLPAANRKQSKMISPKGKSLLYEERDLREKPQELKRVFSWNWEALGCFGVVCSKPFAGEANVTLLLQSYINQQERKEFKARILTMSQFLKDLKSLTVGIQSDTFQHDELIIFSMQPHVTLEGILPATLLHFVEDFLECGTCYKRLQTMIMKRNYKLMFEGFIFKALCSAIDEYLLTFRQYVFSKKDEHLMEFYKRMKRMMKQLINLSYTLAIHPNVDINTKPPMGSKFLGYLYCEIMRLTEKDYITLLIFILKRCCHVYFKHLQKWIYYGLLDDPCNELFINFVDHYRQNTKYFYDKAYFVRKESIPGFFQNYEDEILQCGKYTMLLKAYKPNHPIFDLEYPGISVCLSFDEIQELELVCIRYRENARRVCANPVTIREIFERKAAKKRELFQRMAERSKANLDRWTEEQQEIALIIAKKKKKRLQELTNQLQDAKQRKVQERKVNVELQLRYLHEAEKLQEQRLLGENINLRKRIEYYQELSDMMKDEGKVIAISTVDATPNLTTLQLLNDNETPRGPPLATPSSTGTPGTDFQSCFDEDDEQINDDDCDSEYEECISDDFVEKFADCEKHLAALYDINEEDEENANDLLNQASATTLVPFTKENEKGYVNLEEPTTGITRTVSDVLNCNELPGSFLTDAQQNRLKALDGTNLSQCIVQIETNNDSYLLGYGSRLNLSEAQRNRLKVLDSEFGMLSMEKMTPDINLNNLPECELTDLQRNRRRMMQTDLFSEYNKDPLEARTNLFFNLNTERARNRQKILASEFDIQTGIPFVEGSSSSLICESITSPMSTTSDDVLSAVDSFSSIGTRQQKDIENGNLADVFMKTSDLSCATYLTDMKCELKVNTKLANENKFLSVPTGTSFAEFTPESALNTVGYLYNQGFIYPSQQQGYTYDKQQQTILTDIADYNESQHIDDACPIPDYTDPYKRCTQLLQSNFKCNTLSAYIRLNSAKKEQCTKPSKLAPLNCKGNNNNISVITLTEFLQKSVIIPLTTHLELINNEVMRMCLEDLLILDHFRSLRNYYFLMDGEFGAIICDGIIGKLEDGASPEILLNYQMLHSILDNALGSSITGNDKNSENLSFVINDVPQSFDLLSPNVLNNLSLSYRVDWPLNLILNPETIEQYAKIFKYLIRVRRISWILERAYQILQQTVKKHGNCILKAPQYRHVQLIRHKFYHFVHTLQNHITANALQASWKTFKDELLAAKTIEDIYRKHAVYIKRILFLCMLNKRSAEFYNTIENIFKISLRFYNNLKSHEFTLRSGSEHFTHSRYDRLISDEMEFDKFIKYTIYLGNKIVRYGYQAEIGEFIGLINYNQYYMQNTY
ncbi:uncharacterized protein LOC119631811 [Glossina fuscipes]|uniref:Uncharacterized protein LOC119631811 n=1 Tax=Glossina fuscipes TaxID=7396 RepID=A0A8U0W584_9MUSC|nr:uncharacterized protein LOC119631811 [Glossina fuscipes]XP_037880268.1 uncharacterized protein LOC119631811 [Glossina fuscipes]